MYSFYYVEIKAYCSIGYFTYFLSVVIFLSLISAFVIHFVYFVIFSDESEPVPLALPNQWLWDIIDEFIYQVFAFVHLSSFDLDTRMWATPNIQTYYL